MILSSFTHFRDWFATSPTPVGPDGLPPWPIAKVRSGGFDNGFSGIDRPIDEFPITLSVNGQVADAVPGIHEYDWYLSQRSDQAARQYFAVAHLFSFIGDAVSGSIVLSLTDLAVAELAISLPTSPLNTDRLIQTCKNVHVYVKRRSDGAIQWVDLLKQTLSPV